MFSTPYNLHNTLLSILNKDDDKLVYNKIGECLFTKKLEGKKTCHHFKIKEDWCKCDDVNFHEKDGDKKSQPRYRK